MFPVRTQKERYKRWFCSNVGEDMGQEAEVVPVDAEVDELLEDEHELEVVSKASYCVQAMLNIVL